MTGVTAVSLSCLAVFCRCLLLLSYLAISSDCLVGPSRYLAPLSRLTVAFVLLSRCLSLSSFLVIFLVVFFTVFCRALVMVLSEIDCGIMCRRIELCTTSCLRLLHLTFVRKTFQSMLQDSFARNFWCLARSSLTLQRCFPSIKHTVSCRMWLDTLMATHSISKQAVASINQLCHIWELSSDSNYYKYCS